MTKKNKKKKPKRKFSILCGLGLAAGVTTSFSRDRTPIAHTIYNGITNPAWGLDNTGADIMLQTLGYDPRGEGSWHIPTFTVALIGSALASRILGKLGVNRVFEGLPWIGKKIKF